MTEKYDKIKKAEDAAKVEQIKKAEDAVKAKVTVKEYKVKTDLGFEKRNYSIGGRRVLLIAGEKVTKEIFDSFHEKVQELYFELV